MDLKAIVVAAAVLAVSTDIADAELASRLMKKLVRNQYFHPICILISSIYITDVLDHLSQTLLVAFLKLLLPLLTFEHIDLGFCNRQFSV